jgi:PAS domain S-box-containing protein
MWAVTGREAFMRWFGHAKGFADRTVWDSSRPSVLALVMLLASGGMILALVEVQRQQSEAASWVSHTLEVLEKTAALNADLQTAISESRGFVISHDPADRARWEVATGRLGGDMAALRRLVADDPAQQAAVEQLDKLIEVRLALIRRTLDIVLAQGPAPPSDPTRQATAVHRSEQVQQSLARLAAQEKRLLSVRQRQLAEITTVIWAGLVACGITVAASLLLKRAVLLKRRTEQRHAAEIARVNSTLEANVAERTRALALSEARQRRYFEDCADGIMILSQTGDGGLVHTDVNSAFGDIVGMPRAAVIGKKLQVAWSDADAVCIAERAQTCRVCGRPERFTLKRMRGGEVRTVEISLSALADSPGVVVGSLCDITERQAQAAAAERAAVYFNNSQDVLTVLQVRGHGDGAVFFYEAISPSFEALFERRVADLLGKMPASWMPAALAERTLASYRTCLTTGQPVQISETVALLTHDVDIAGVVTPVRDPDSGNIIRLITLIRDVTESRRAQAIATQQQRMEATGRIAGGVAHEFNNILQVISGSLEMICNRSTEAEQVQALADLALQAIKRGATVSGHLLVYGRRQLLRPQTVAPIDFIMRLQFKLIRLLPSTVAVTLDLDPATPAVLADPAQLEIALVCLVSNAGEAMPLGGVLTLETRVDATMNPPRVIISVGDTGSGMDATTLARAHEPFFGTRGLAACGLGLSMVHGFAAGSGGALRIASIPNGGTRVELCLPAAPDAQIRADGTIVERGAVLLIDDTTDALITTNAFLVGAGLRVVTAATADAALAMLAAGQRFDAMVSDVVLPGMGGFDVITESRRYQPGLPAVIVSGFSGFEGRAGLPADARIVAKPVDRRVLIDTLREIMLVPSRYVPPGMPPGVAAVDLAAEGGKKLIR